MREQGFFPVASVGAIALIVLVFVRPQEFMPALEGLPLFNIAFGISVLGCLVELVLGRLRTLPVPLLGLVGAWIGWSLLVSSFRLGVGNGFSIWLTSIIYQVIFMGAVLLGAQTFRRLRTVAVVIITIAVCLSGVMIHQSQQDFTCIQFRMEENGAIDSSNGEADGRSCENVFDCEKNAPDPKASYGCERAGLMGSFTIAGRIRWRGRLADPNEVCVFLGAALALAFGLHAGATSAWRNVGLAIVLGLTGMTAVLSQSRGGLLVMLVVCAIPFVRRYGLRGIAVACFLVSPLFLFGGREGAEAEESANERISLLYQGIDVVKADPIFGVGVDAFRDYVYPPMTAHNSYLLAAAELGFFGMFLFVSMLYVAFKIPLTIVAAPPDELDPKLFGFALGLASAMMGTAVGIFFLTMDYHPLPFILFGLSGALYGTVRGTAPEFRVTYSFKEMAWVAVFCGALLTFLYAYTRIRGIS